MVLGLAELAVKAERVVTALQTLASLLVAGVCVSTAIARHTGELAATGAFHLVEAGLTGLARVARVVWWTVTKLST